MKLTILLLLAILQLPQNPRPTSISSGASVKQPVAYHMERRTVSSGPQCQWQREQALWSVPCGYAIYLSAAGPHHPAHYGFAPTLAKAHEEIRKIWQADQARGLVRCQ